MSIPDDWRVPGVTTIIDRTLKQVAAASPDRSANVILLHDGGGPRDETVTALPVIIDRLRAEGYHFVPVSQLAGLSRDAVMPPVSASDRLAVQADIAIFVVLAGVSYTIKLDLLLRHRAWASRARSPLPRWPSPTASPHAPGGRAMRIGRRCR